MQKYVFKEEFLEENRPKIVKNSSKKKGSKNYFENTVKFIFVQSIICFSVVLVVFVLSLFAPKSYTKFKKAYITATTQTDIRAEDVKKLLTAAYNFVFSANNDAEKTGSGGDVSGKNVSLNEYILTSQISAPTKGVVTSPFGSRIHPIFKTESSPTLVGGSVRSSLRSCAIFLGPSIPLK